jgi:hypothetical protein
VRLCTPAFPGEKATIYHAHQKVAHRAHTAVEVEQGNHDAIGPRLEPVRGWHPIEILHFSLRSVEQLAWKGQGGWRHWSAEEQTEHQIRLDRASNDGRLDEFFAEHVVSDADLERGLAAGTLAIDTRLRDALRTIGDGAGGFRSPGQVEALDFSVPGIEASAAFAAEASVLAAIDAIPRAEARVAALESRIAALRTLPRR